MTELEGRELDAAVAEKVFGKPSSYYDCPHFDKNRRMLSFCSCPDLPRYSRDIAAAMQVEDRIEELGLEETYINRLIRLLGISAPYLDQLFILVHASPEDRCRAALLTAEAE